MSSIHPGENSYVIDPESSVEMARLMDQDAMLTKHMGGLFPPDLDLSGVHDILDLACGPGGWGLEVAFTYPEKRVTGIDISRTMIMYAQAQAQVRKLTNINFHIMDATERLRFPDASFDLVNARLIVGFLWREAWPALIKECWRILRPGGIIRITDTDYPGTGITTSPALDRFSRLVCKAAYRTGRSFAPDEDAAHFCLTPKLRQFFMEAGFQEIHEQPHMLNYSFGSDGHLNNYHNLEVAFKLMIPFVAKAGVAPQAELEELHRRMLHEMSLESFKAVWYFMSAWGEKPQSAA